MSTIEMQSRGPSGGIRRMNADLETLDRLARKYCLTFTLDDCEDSSESHINVERACNKCHRCLSYRVDHESDSVPELGMSLRSFESKAVLCPRCQQQLDRANAELKALWRGIGGLSRKEQMRYQQLQLLVKSFSRGQEQEALV